MRSRPVLRTCVGCRMVREQGRLIRLTADAERTLRVDPHRGPRAPGRGAYLCPSLACFDRAWQRQAFARALRQERHGLDREAVRRTLEADLRRRGAIGGYLPGGSGGEQDRTGLRESAGRREEKSA